MDYRHLKHHWERVVEVKRPELTKGYWPRVRKQIILIIAAVQLAGLAGLISWLYFSGLLEAQWLAGIIIGASWLLLTSLLARLLYTSAAQPLADLLAAIVHISGEPTATPPPNPNAPQYQKSGLKPVLQAIYELSSKRTPDQEVTGTEKPEAPLTSVLEDALGATSSGFVVINQKREIVYANNAAPIRITQAGKTELALLFNTSDTFDAWLDECEARAVSAERLWTRIPDRLPEDEDRRFFDVLASYRKGVENEVVLTLVDRTPVYTTSEEDLDFIAFAAHELRGPITVIRGYLDVLESELQEVLHDDHHELFRRLTVSANKLSGYINNILNTSRYDRRHLKLYPVETTMAAVYDTIRDDMALRASSQGRILNVEIPADLPTIAADVTSLSEVFSNLIDNAIKYSHEGGAINVTGSKHGDMVDIAIQDHGIGMPGNVVSNLFQKFFRSHRSRETVSGTGIGLYISKAIVDSHGGTISVRSEEGKGSTFTVSLPTYATVAEKLKTGSNEAVIKRTDGWIKNHNMFRG